MKPIQTKHELQFDYFSENYHQFEMDFYKWAATSTPLDVYKRQGQIQAIHLGHIDIG